MVSRAIALVVAIVAALFGAPLSAVATSPTTVVSAYAYDGHHHAATTADTTSERAPPGCVDTTSANQAVDHWSRGAAPRIDGPTPLPTYGYNDGLLHVQFGEVAITTKAQIRRTDGESVSHCQAGVAAKALPAFPKALAGGAEDTYVYFGTRGGKNVYTGITNNLTRRGAQHGERFDQLVRLTNQPVTRGQARSIEQALIARNPGFENKINSISPSHSYYDDAVSWGEAWLRQNGF